ncbi:hypothetical protein FOCC_FOCC016992 [Frankliniella occidentalis]|nr:hypothetical protein FOCC_FOCC016992 [Frankliniella occidentalis]
MHIKTMKTEATQEDINNFIAALSKNEEKTRWQYHLELKYSDYELDFKGKKRLAMLCRKFLKNLPDLIVVENAPLTEGGLISYTYQSLPENTVFEIPGTQSQGESDSWVGRRSVLVTASVAHRAFHLTETGLSGFLYDQLWNIDPTITPAMRYGTSKESTARNAYMDWRHENRDAKAKIDGKLGLHVNSSYPGLGCSPDGIVYSDTMPPVLLEIKCLAVLKKIRPQDFQQHLKKEQLERFCLTIDANGEFRLKDTHKFYCQIQLSLGILKLKEADLALWSIKDILVVPVPFDKNFFDALVVKITKLHREVIVPEFWEMRVPRKLNPIRLIY